MSIITGVTTDKEFLKEISNKGSNISNNAEPISLLRALNQTGSAVSFDSENMNVVDSVNTIMHSQPTKVADYLYEIEFNDINYNLGYQYTRDTYLPLGKCSSASSNGFFGRNFDWYYDNQVSFIIKVPANEIRHASIGVAGNIKQLTKSFVESGEESFYYNVLPFATLDGINDAGVVANTNVVPFGDYGYTIGTKPLIEKRHEIGIPMIIRFILDNFSTATEAVNYIKNYVSLYAANSEYMIEEFHIMVADKDKTYIIETINNEVNIVEHNAMTNFYISNVEFNDDGTVYTPETNTAEHDAIKTNHITVHGCGLERYNALYSQLDNISSVNDMRDVMNSIMYTNAYKDSTDPYWYTELTGDYGDLGELTVVSTLEEYAPIVAYFKNMFEHRTRDVAETWQTVHSSVYDINNKTLNIVVQEDKANEYTYTLE